MKKLPLLLILAFAVSAVIGCNKNDNTPVASTVTTPLSQSAASSIGLTGRWKTVTNKAENISIRVPASWPVIDMTPGRLDSSLDHVAEVDPSWTGARAMVRSSPNTNTAKLMARSDGPDDVFPRGISIFKFPMMGKSLDDLVQGNNKLTEKSLGVHPVTAKAKLPAGNAIVTKYQKPLGEIKVSFVNYFVQKGKSYFLITTMFPADATKAMVTELQQIVNTVDLGS